jgi:hypothetical protein
LYVLKHFTTQNWNYDDLPVAAAFIRYVSEHGVGNLSSDWTQTSAERRVATWESGIRILYEHTTKDSTDQGYLEWLRDYSRWTMHYIRERDEVPQVIYPFLTGVPETFE